MSGEPDDTGPAEDGASRYICIHGHFYQPPRENPWLEEIELQESAYPYHDWNERVGAECYAPNAASRILDARGRIVRIVNNYARISFNFGPTLLKWLEDHDPFTYEAVLRADEWSAERFSGHGSALAQPYNHMIMPLADERDRRTQVIWGLRDFEHRFGRRPEGMWLPEAAVDLATLDVLADQGIAFTVLAPGQAARVRGPEDDAWTDVSGGRVDPTRPYVQRLPSGRSIALFFYDGPISRGVAFEGLLKDGERFSRRLQEVIDEDRDGPQLVHIATDGETYGHHHRHGDMALAYALRDIEETDGVRLTNYGEYLERHPPSHEVQITEDSSWSCVHGIERWRSDCGCSTGGRPGWNQRWRAPLREALDWLRDELAPRYEEVARHLLEDPWAARDAYIDVILDREPESIAAFLERHAHGEPGGDAVVRIMKLLELQRHALLMYTSCGWFFNDLSGIETVQVLEYAARAIQLAAEVLGEDLEAPFLERLSRAESNLPEQGDGRRIYERRVRPALVELTDVAAHHAISSVFDVEGRRERVYCYEVDDRDRQRYTAGRAQLVSGRLGIRSVITGETGAFTYAVLHFGDHNVTAGVRPLVGPEEQERIAAELAEPFQRAELPAVLRALDRHFAGSTFNLKSLFRDEQRAVLELILGAELEEAEGVYHQLYQRHAPLTRFIGDLPIPMPNAFEMTAEFVLNTSLRRELSDPELDPARVEELLEEAVARGVPLDAEGLGFALESTLETLGRRLREAPDEPERLERLAAATALVPRVPFEVNTWGLQNIYWKLLQEVYPGMRERADRGDELAAAGVELLHALGETLKVAVPET